MAILAMDQLARVIAAELEGAQLVHLRNEVDAVHDAGKIPVLAPHAWLRAADPLPHSWDITSDSIAAYIAGVLEASELILLKPVDGPLEALVDRGFATTRPAGLPVRIATPATLGHAAAT
jgi:5-(aminomethyl)-3-furanmethanol phosphate kinase